jgi:hypothetical protein
MEELDVRLDDGTALQLMFKNVSRQTIPEVARLAKPAFLYNPLREIEAYRTVLASDFLGTATCYGAVVDPPAGHYWLFLERVTGPKLWQVGELPVWQEAARWLAALHSRFAGETELLTGRRAGQLLRYDGPFYWRWPRRARAFLRHAGPSVPVSARRRMEELAGRYGEVVERLLALPVTVIHGEFYPSNVIVQEAGSALRVCPVDWEMAAVGPGLIDLAALTAGTWTDEERAALVSAYHEALRPDGAWPPPLDEFETALGFCQLHLAVQWLGWSPDWTPPPAHAQNWLGEALRLAEKLGF